MSDALSPKSRAFLRSVQHADDPTPGDYDRVRAGVKVRLAASLAAGAGLTAAKAAGAAEGAALKRVTAGATTTASVGTGAAISVGGASASFVTKLAAVVLVVGAATGGAAAVVRHQRSVHADPTATTSSLTPNAEGEPRTPQVPGPMLFTAPAAAMPTTAADAQSEMRPQRLRGPTPVTAPTASMPGAAVPPTAHRSPKASPRTAAELSSPSPTVTTTTPVGPASTIETKPAPSQLDIEIALVRDARAALRSGDATRALVILDEHAQRFPGGALAEDCDAERVSALCALGRGEEARLLARRFVASHPGSPYASAVATSCGGGDK